MKRWVAAVLALIYSVTASAAQLHGAVNFKTHKTVTIVGLIDQEMRMGVEVQLKAVRDLPGPLLVLIHSQGGSVDEGNKIIAMLEAERRPMVCAVLGMAASMAFNILSHCHYRVAVAKAQLMFHRIAIYPTEGERISADDMRKLADQFDKIDAQLDAYNARALRMSAAEYERYALAQKRWNVGELIARGYLMGVITLD